MSTVLSIIGFTLLVMETLVGMVANGFIVLLNSTDWFRSRKLSPTDRILTCLGLSRLLGQIVVLLYVTILSFFPCIYLLDQVALLFVTVGQFTDNINLWFAACLSVLYFARIAIFSHPLFLQVKRSISGLVPWLLLASVILSAVMSAGVVLPLTSGTSIYNQYKSFLSTSNDSEIRMPHLVRNVIIVSLVQNCIPFLIFLSSTILLVTSLWKHTRRLQHSGSSTRDLNTHAHFTAIKALVSFALLHLSSFIMNLSQSVLFWRSNHHAVTGVGFFNVSALYPSGHAIILILINPKLKQAWLGMVHSLKCRLTQAPS